jgi:hypothetical protein
VAHGNLERLRHAGHEEERVSDLARINTLAINFGDKYDARQMRELMQHIQELTRLNQKFIQLLRGGAVVQILVKTGPEDFAAEWRDP